VRQQREAVFNQGGTTSVFVCPDDPATASGTIEPRTYSMNDHFVIAYAPDYSWATSQPISKITKPDTTILIAELMNPANSLGEGSYSNVDCGAQSGPAGWPHCQDSGNSNAYLGKTFHSGGDNYLFCDGHVKWMHPSVTDADNMWIYNQ
jgi:prepilin-type processing-associated H-X9-DG protein